jgi:DNA-binding NarL/FixJ family response regulator
MMSSDSSTEPSPVTEPISVLLLDPQAIFRHGLSQLLAARGQYTVIWDGADEGEAFAACGRYKPQIVIMEENHAAPGEEMRVQKLHRLYPQIKIVILSAHEGRENIHRAIMANARAYLTKDVSTDEFFECLETITKTKKAFLPPKLTVLLQQQQKQKAAALSMREQTIMHHVSLGQSNQEIGSALSISPSTVKNHLNNILAKLQAHDRTHAVMICLRHGYLNLPEIR